MEGNIVIRLQRRQFDLEGWRRVRGHVSWGLDLTVPGEWGDYGCQVFSNMNIQRSWKMYNSARAGSSNIPFPYGHTKRYHVIDAASEASSRFGYSHEDQSYLKARINIESYDLLDLPAFISPARHRMREKWGLELNNRNYCDLEECRF
jgi:hypothetical protein